MIIIFGKTLNCFSFQSNSYHFDASTGTRSICRPDHFNANDTNDNESRIYEELYLAEGKINLNINLSEVI